MLIDKNELRIAIPSKGRLKEHSIDLLKKSGLKFRIAGRQLFANCKETGVIIIFSHAQDIPALVSEGVVDLGITGSDLIIEKNAEVTEYLQLGFGKCRLSFATHRESPYKSAKDLKGKIVGTKFINLAKNFFKEKGIDDVHIIEISGAVEVMVLLGLVDAILDVVETGSSLREHDLLERDSILKAEAVLVGNKKQRNPEMNDKLIRRMQGVLIASKYSLLEYNCPSKVIDDATKITPGYSSPTIQKTDSSEWYAVRVMVEKYNVQQVMDRLESIGCRAILETGMTHCRL